VNLEYTKENNFGYAHLPGQPMLFEGTKREGAKFVGTIPEWAGKVVQMTIFSERLLIACERCVFEVVGDQIKPLSFAHE